MQFLIIQKNKARELREIISKRCKEKGLSRSSFVDSKPKQFYSPETIEIYCTEIKGHTYISTSLENGWPFLQTIIEKEKKDAVSVRYVQDEIAEMIFWSGGQRKRIVQALRDTKWIWYTDGNSLPFEDVESYQKRRIKDRLTRDLITTYLKHLNIEIEAFEAEPYGGINSIRCAHSVDTP